MITTSRVAGWVAGSHKPATHLTCYNADFGWQVEIKPATCLTWGNVSVIHKRWQVFSPCTALTRAYARARACAAKGYFSRTCHPKLLYRCISAGETGCRQVLNLPPEPATHGGAH